MAADFSAKSTTVDVLIIGAGISGINAAYRVHDALPDLSYAILEGREEMGGTWSLFHFPGIRSDSDLYTFGFPWDPWCEDRAIADGASILNYIKTVASRHGIDKHIYYRHTVTKASWSSEQQTWKVDIVTNDTQPKTFYAQFLFMSTGLYDYEEGLPATIPGIENFQGTVVHPQFWPQNLNYENKRMVIIGSGATAVTLIPTLNEKAAHVTMLQRSPGYYVSVPTHNAIDDFIRRWTPVRLGAQILRLKYICGFYLTYHMAISYPEYTKKQLRKGVEAQLPKDIPFEPHFLPFYNPWEQRLCVTPQGDFFQALRSGNSDVVTDQIETVDKTGIILKSGKRLDADIIVTATGLKMLLFGKVEIVVDGEPVDHSEKFVWRGAGVQDVPNFFFAFGYPNASWTLGADMSALLFVQLLREMKKQGIGSATPTVENPEAMEELPFLAISSNYVLKAIKARQLPKSGNMDPWKPRSSYFDDAWKLISRNVTGGLNLTPASRL